MADETDTGTWCGNLFILPPPRVLHVSSRGHGAGSSFISYLADFIFSSPSFSVLTRPLL